MPGLRSIDLSLNRSLLAAREVKTPTGWIIPPDLNALVILQPQSQTSSIRHLVCVFKSYPLRKAGSQNDKYSSTHRLGVPNATQPFRPWLRQELGVLGRFGDTVIVGGLATLRMPGSLEIGRRPTGAVGEFSISLPFFGTRRLYDYLECLNTWDTCLQRVVGVVGFPGQKLSNVKPLGSLMRLVAVDFSGCDALQDVTPLLGGGYDPPADSMADLLLGFSWLVGVCQAVFRIFQVKIEFIR